MEKLNPGEGEDTYYSVPSFLLIKKPATTGEEEGWITPSASNSSMYFSMASVSDSLSTGREGGTRKEVDLQSYGRWGSREMAHCLTKTWA